MKLIFQKTIKGLFIILFILSFASCRQDNSFTLTGKNFDDRIEGAQIIFYSVADTLHSWTSFDSVTVTNGSFQINGNIDYPTLVKTFIIPKEGARSPGFSFILEKGDLVFDFSHNNWGKLKIENGYYNELVLYSWKFNENFMEFDLQSKRNMIKMRNLPNDSARIYYQENVRPYSLKRDSVKYSILKNIIENHEDLHARLLAYVVDDYTYTDFLKKIAILSELKTAGADPIVTGAKIRRLMRAEEQLKAINAYSVGGLFPMFVSKNAENTAFDLADILSKNKYVLVEFWASWCNPCRKEIPHLKTAYSKYKSKGFEIFGHSVDESRDKWLTASEKEQIPWLDLSDDKGFKSPVIKTLGISGIPQNYLVDNTGKIVAVNLRGEGLLEKLEELID